jgi:hypothetical protein
MNEIESANSDSDHATVKPIYQQYSTISVFPGQDSAERTEVAFS